MPLVALNPHSLKFSEWHLHVSTWISKNYAGSSKSNNVLQLIQINVNIQYPLMSPISFRPFSKPLYLNVEQNKRV